MSGLQGLIQKGEAVPSIQRHDTDYQAYAEWRSQALACLRQVFGPADTYTKSFESQAGSRARGLYRNQGLGILRAAAEDLERGYLQTVEQMAAAEVFSNFIDQADHLLQSGYHVPAASLAGAVLEDGLRSLAERNDIAVKVRDDLSALNNKLGEKGTYNRLRQQQVNYWAKVRNAADHGRFDEVTKNDVTDLVKGVQAFLAEYL